ncbi:MAG: lipid-binding SYLF domain-containing protein [Candidatus Atribacteria bacterium]
MRKKVINNIALVLLLFLFCECLVQAAPKSPAEIISESISILILREMSSAEDRGSISITAGPLGRSLSADTDYKFKALIYSYSISKGAYIGASFQGSTIEEDESANKEFYGSSISNRTILKNKIPINPEVLKILFLINKISRDSF